MKTPTITFKGTVLDELADLGIFETEATRQIRDAIRCAERIAGLGLRRVDAVRNESRNDEKAAWRNDSHLVTYFGEGSLTIEEIKDVRRRLGRAFGRLSEKSLTLRVFPQTAAPSSQTNAQNLGSVWSPKTFKLFTNWFRYGPLQRGGIILHELNHDLFVDQKLDGETVYGEDAAKALATEKPKQARKSAENYEWCCMRLVQPTGAIS